MNDMLIKLLSPIAITLVLSLTYMDENPSSINYLAFWPRASYLTMLRLFFLKWNKDNNNHFQWLLKGLNNVTHVNSTTPVRKNNTGLILPYSNTSQHRTLKTEIFSLFLHFILHHRNDILTYLLIRINVFGF